MESSPDVNCCVWSFFACLTSAVLRHRRCYSGLVETDRIRLEVSLRLVTASQVDSHKHFVLYVEGLLALFSVSIFAL